MDTISRDSNNSMLPVGGIIAGVVGLLVGIFGLVQASKANKAIEALQPQVESKLSAVESSANNALAAAESTKKELVARMREVQAGFDTMGPAIGNLQASVSKLEEAAKKPVVAEKGGKKGEAPVAGPGEYVVKSGDTGMKIATANKVSVNDLVAVNPGVNWNKLGAGQKIKLPAKK
jgi:LysM repeat protein